MLNLVYLVAFLCLGFSVNSVYSQLRGDKLATVYLGDRIDVTFGKYSTIPDTESDAISAGWTLLNTQCGTYGKRYRLAGDYALTVLFDADGVAAGIQAAIPSLAQTSWQNFPNIYEVLDGVYTVSIFFRNPSTICTAGTAVTDGDYFGDRLLLRYSDGSYENLPIDSDDLTVGAPDWVLSPCFVTMGTHYWKNITTTSDCKYSFPAGVMYTRGNLRTFLFNVVSSDGSLQQSARWEHPSASDVAHFFYDADKPACFSQTGVAVSTIHVFIQNPVWNNCIG